MKNLNEPLQFHKKLNLCSSSFKKKDKNGKTVYTFPKNTKPCWPEIETLTAKFSIREPSGNNVKFTCKSGSNPNSRATWVKLPKGIDKPRKISQRGNLTIFDQLKDLDQPIILRNNDRNSQIIIKTERKQNKISKHTLYINPVQKADTGIYVCNVTNSVGYNLAFFNVIIQQRPLEPHVTVDKDKLNLYEGESAQVLCKTEPETWPLAYIEWKTNKTWSLPQGNEPEGESLRARFQQRSAAKESHQSKEEELNDIWSEGYSPSSSTPPLNPFSETSTSELDDGPWIGIENFAIITKSKSLSQKNKNNDQKYLNITKATLNDTGYYQCYAKNSIGDSFKIIKLTVKKRPLLEARTIWVLVLITISALAILVIYCTWQLIVTKKFTAKLADVELTEKRLLPIICEDNLPKIKSEEEPIEPNQEILYRRLATDCINAERNLQMQQAQTAKMIQDMGLPGQSMQGLPGMQGMQGLQGPAPDNILQLLNIPPDLKWEILRSQVILKHQLGIGFFGQVHKAEILGLSGVNSNKTTIAAVKMLNSDPKAKDVSDLFEEIKVLKNVSNPKHKNIINLIGVCTQNGPIYVILEYAHYGNLRDFLRNYKAFQITQKHLNQSEFSNASNGNDNFEKTALLASSDSNAKGSTKTDNKEGTQTDHFSLFKNFTLTTHHLCDFSSQISNGMEYLHEKKVIHRDLAARNILLTENLVIKIADFGLAREVGHGPGQDYYRKNGPTQLPWRWMSPEALTQSIFTTANDVWSFGIVLWEIHTLGGVPYTGIKHKQLINFLKTGSRLKRPQYCCETIYKIMKECWAEDCGNRPMFSNLSKRFLKILKKIPKNYLNSRKGDENNKVNLEAFDDECSESE